MARWVYDRIVDDAIERFCRRASVTVSPDAELVYHIDRIDDNRRATGRHMHVATELAIENGGYDVLVTFSIVVPWDGGEPTVRDVRAIRRNPADGGDTMLSWADDTDVWELIGARAYDGTNMSVG